MENKDKTENLSEGAKNLIEDLADLEHQQWIHWTKYFLRHHHYKNFRKRWKKQIETPYNKLSEKEKEPDRVWAKKVLWTLWNNAERELKEKQNGNK